MCVRPISLKKLTGYDSAIVPCGKCPECLAHRANDLSVRVVREAQYLGNFFLVTFTYDNEHIPLVMSDYVVDMETGEESFIDNHKAYGDRQVFFDNAPFTWQVNKEGKKCKRYEPYLIYSDTDGRFLYNRFVYFSVDNSYFQKFMKSSRIYYQRHFGELPKFKYLAVPEYGGVTYRPHIHCLFFGLPEDIIDFFISRWTYGSIVDKKKVKYDFEDFSKVSHYVSQYACKGSFDCPYIFSGHCYLPKRCFSREFGVGDPEELSKRESFWKCEDVFGQYDFDDLSSFSDDVRSELVSSVFGRRFYDLNGYKYPIPQYLKRRMFYKSVLEPEAVLLRDCINDKSLSYEERQNIIRRLSFCTSVRNGKVSVKRVYPNSSKKVASQLQRLVTSALFEQLHRRLAHSLDEQSSVEVQSLSSLFPLDNESLQTAFVCSQKAQEKASELHLLNTIYRSVF